MIDIYIYISEIIYSTGLEEQFNGRVSPTTCKGLGSILRTDERKSERMCRGQGGPITYVVRMRDWYLIELREFTFQLSTDMP